MPGGMMDGGSVDKPKPPPPKAPEKLPPPDAAKPPPAPDTTRPADKQQDGKGGKDNQAAAAPQGGKPPEVPKGDAAAHQTGDTSGRQTGDGGQRGDAPAKIDGGGKPGDPGGKPGDAPHQAGDHPGWKLSTDMGQFQNRFEHLDQPHPDGRPPTGSADVKGAQQLDKFTHRLDLDECRGENGKFDREKLRTKLGEMVQHDRQERTVARLHAANDRDYHGPRPSGRPMEVTVRIENARSYVDVRDVQAAMQTACDKYRFNGQVEIPGRPPEQFKPHAVQPHDHGAGRLKDPPVDPRQIRTSQEGVRPPRPQVPTVQPTLPNTHRGK